MSSTSAKLIQAVKMKLGRRFLDEHVASFASHYVTATRTVNLVFSQKCEFIDHFCTVAMDEMLWHPKWS